MEGLRPIAKVRLARDCLAFFLNIPPTEGFLFTLASCNSPQFTNASANYIHLENSLDSTKIIDAVEEAALDKGRTQKEKAS